jgi:predicted esterase
MRRICVLGLASLFMLASCGRGSSDPGASPAEQTSSPGTSVATGPAEPSVRDISVTFDGRTFAGHCAGEASGGPTVILESGSGGDQTALFNIEAQLSARTMVCAYDRAGIGGSDPPSQTPRPVTDLVSDLHGFLDSAEIEPPYLLVGQSIGANIAFMYAQAYPNDVVGFVSMNPVPPYTNWIRAARRVETPTELKNGEIAFYEGENDEQVAFQGTDAMLKDPLPDSMPYVVMFAEDCDGDTEFCGRILPPLSSATKALASVGGDGSFIWVKDAGHEIYVSHLDTVMKTIDGVLSQV